MGILKKSTRKFLVSIAGFPVILIGIILIPLPGPGLLVVLLGLIILSVEYDWAKRYTDKLREMQRKAIEKAKAQKEKAKLDYMDEKRAKNNSKSS